MLTLTQLYDLGKLNNIDIFEGINLPLNSPINRTVLINAIIERCGLNIPVYADPNTMASAVALWSAKNQYTFEHIGKVLTASYSPIENTDKEEIISIEHERNLKDNTVGNNKKNEKLHTSGFENSNSNENIDKTTEEDGSVSQEGSDTVTAETTVSAYNSSDYQPDNKTETTTEPGITTTTDNDTTENTKTNANSSTNTGADSTKNTNVDITNDKKVNETETTTTTTRLHGNIGVMSNQSMLTEEYELVGKFNPYTFISGLFENELTIFVY